MTAFKRWLDAAEFLATVSGDCSILLEVLAGCGIYRHCYRPGTPITRGQLIGVYRPAKLFGHWRG